MDDIIHQILDIDARAQRKLQQAYEDRDHMKEELDGQVAKIQNAERAAFEEKVQQQRESRRKQQEIEVEAIRQNAQAAIQKLTDEFQGREDEWLRHIVESVLNG